MSKKKEDYYTLLGVKRDASVDEIKKAYKRLAMKYHPDRNSEAGAKDKFQAISEAYEVLSNQGKRSMYDQYGHAGVDANMGGGQAGAGNFNDIFEEMFGSFFGGGSRSGGGGSRHRGRPGHDLRCGLELSLEDAAAGYETKLKVRTKVQCSKCHGSGSKDGAKPNPCKTCGGHGQVRMQQGIFSVQQTCPSCHGEGQVITDHCRTCAGSGLQPEEKVLSVKIPAGVDTGDNIRLSGEGEAGTQGGGSGDLYVHIKVKEHAVFRREANNLLCEVPISLYKASVGGEIEVPTLQHGRISLKIPKETQSGKVFRLRERGVRDAHGRGPGDLLCKVVVETPVSLTPAQQELLRQFEDSTQAATDKFLPKQYAWQKRVADSGK
jgi:molecular chaperone DnaJ